MKFGSVCSGIEAASVAWEPMGWNASWFAEIEPFPSAVLNHHWPHVSNLGDMTMIAEMVANDEVEAPDVLVGGTPCQAFSVAGARKSLDDHRGQLSLEYIKLANSIDDKRIENQKQPSIIVWENVPGVLNTKDNAFGCFLGALAGESSELQPTGGRWSNAGIVFGPQRAIAWRILDAQYFGVAQRRRRVFVVASARKGFNPAKVLFEWEGVRRDIAPSRSAGQDVTGSASQGFASSSFAQYRPVDGDGATIKASGGDLGGDLGGGSENLIVSGTVSGKYIFQPLMASMGSKLWLGNQEAFSGDYFVCHGTQDPITQDNQAFPLGRNHSQENVVYCGTQNDACREVDLAKTIDTTVPCPSKNQGGVAIVESSPQAYTVIADVTPKVGEDICVTLRAKGGGGIVPPSVFDAYQHHERREAEKIGTLTCGQNNNVRGDTPLVADTIPLNSMTMLGRPSDDISFTLTKGDRHGVATGLVRRLTPIECERLQGFPDNHTQIPYRNKSADLCPDGPRYAACGNSMAVPVMAWIGQRINQACGNAL